VLVESGVHGLRVACANAPARADGVGPGMALPSARAILPDLAAQPIDRTADVRALKALALWARRYSPWTHVDGRDGLKLDITGAAHLFGGEAQLMADLSARLTRFGVIHALGLADTRSAAWAMARFGHDGARLVPPGGTEAALSPLPIAALDLDADSTRLLRRLGLASIGQLIALQRSSLERRFHSAEPPAAVLTRLDEALGRRATPFSALAPEPVRHVRLTCPEPLITLDAVRLGLERLLPDLTAILEKHGEGARHVAFQICRVDGSAAHIEIGATRATREPKHLMRLFAEKLERLDPGFGVDALILDALRVERMDAAPRSLTALGAHDAARGDSDAADRLADRIAARFGEHAVRRLAPRNRWLPEHAEAEVSTALTPSAPAPSPSLPPRPLRLLDTPEAIEALAEVPDGPPARFTWRRVARRVVRAQGPERIAAEWWSNLDDRNTPRDYYAVEDEEGRRYWLFRDGLYNTPEATPMWYVHGLFT